MSPPVAFEAARDTAEALGPATDPLLFALAAALVLALALFLLLGGRAHRRTDDGLCGIEDLVSTREAKAKAPDA